MTDRGLQVRPGMSLIEVLIAAVVAGIVLLALGGFIMSNLTGMNKDRDRTFAQQKALQMFEELSAYEPTSSADSGPDRFAQEGLRYRLTIEERVVAHAPLSGNPMVNNKYKFVRLITSQVITGDPNGRNVSVKVYYQDPKATTPTPLGKPLAVVSGTLRSNVAQVGPKQVIDVYAISIDNMPHLYRKDSDRQYFPSAKAARLNFRAGLAAIETANPGLRFRVQYITRTSVGRDPSYRPYMNEALHLHDSGRDPLDWAYFYPGRIENLATSPRYYDYTAMDGNLRVNLSSGTVSQGKYPYADQWNHAVRYPAELAGFNTASPYIPTGVPTSSDISPLSLRQFLEDMLQDTTGKYKNAIVTNLHGELFPGIPLRNYSDAAKDPVDPDTVDTDLTDPESAPAKRRVVTHPYKLNFATTDPVLLLVHPFMNDGSNTPSLTPTGVTSDIYPNAAFPEYAQKARITVKGIKPYLVDNLYTGLPDLTADIKDVKIEVIQRYKSPGGGTPKYVKLMMWPQTLTSGTKSADTQTRPGGSDHHGPHISAEHGGGPDPVFNGNDLVIEIRDLDFDARKVTDGADIYGIDTGSHDYKLHGLQYFPDPYLPLLHLKNGGTRPRNTARVLIEFNLNPLTVPADARFEVVTQLYDKNDAVIPAAVEPAAQPQGVSKAWFYMGRSFEASKGLYWNTTTNRETIPWSEQLQLVGDPRYNPYFDVRKNKMFNPYFTDWNSNDEVYKNITNDTGDATKFLYVGSPSSDYSPLSVPPLFAADRVDLRFPESSDSWNGVQFNAPAYFALWREALLRNQVLFLNPVGEPMRFIGLGGEFALEKYVNDGPDLKLSKKPWDGSTSDAGAESDELFDSRVVYMEQYDDSWWANPWIGELFPTVHAANWPTVGNLPTGTNSTDFKRSTDGAIGLYDNFADDGSTSGKYVYFNLGFPAFLNATVSGGTTPLDMIEGGNGDKGALTSTGDTAAKAIKMALMGQPKGPWGYKLSGGGTPPEWNQAAYTVHHIIEWLNGGLTPVPYYTHKDATQFGSNPIMMTAGTSDSRKAYFLANTFRPQSMGQITDVMAMSNTAMLTTYYDATRQGIGQYNIKPVPRVRAMKPQTGQTFTGAAVPLEWFARYIKTDGTAYTPFYAYDPAQPPSSGGPHDVVFFVKYRCTLAGIPWTTAKLSSPVTSAAVTVDGALKPIEEGKPVFAPGVNPVPNTPLVAGPPPYHKLVGSWDISGLPDGTYDLRIEAFRKDAAGNILPVHYAYHEIPVTIDH